MAADPQALLARMIEDMSIEIGAGDTDKVAALRAWFAPGTQVYVSWVPGHAPAELVSTAAALRRAGYIPVPHVVARALPDRDALAALLAGLASEAAVDRALVVAGDLAQARGPFADSVSVIESGLLERHGIGAIGVAGHPEGHPRMPEDGLWPALDAKIAAARRHGLSSWIVTQFGFDAGAIAAWAGALRARGIAAPVRIGLAGPASIATLVKFALRCGVGASLRLLQRQPDRVARLFGSYDLDALVESLAAELALSSGPEPGLHLFPFGGIARAGEWREARRGAAVVRAGGRPPV